jgi:RNA-binding protein
MLNMRNLKGFERTYLRGLAHNIKPVVQIGKSGITNEVTASINEALAARELIKVKFIDFKEDKKAISEKIEEVTRSVMAGMIGNTAIFFREHPDEAKRKIRLPVKERAREIRKSE